MSDLHIRDYERSLSGSIRRGEPLDPAETAAQRQAQERALAEAMVRRQKEAQPRDRRRWTKADWALQAAFTAATLADWLQTQTDIVPNPKYEEANPLLGKHPSTAKLALGTGAAMLGHAAIARALPQPYRRIWQLGGLGVEGAVVGRNHGNGVRINLGRLF